MEILSPIKNLNNAKIAIKNGADALYLASPSFGARVNASMSMEEIHNIISLANSYDVKTYITFNTIVFEDEIKEFFKQVDEIYTFGANGIIIQDFSFIKIIKNFYPDLEVHCSTQMHIHNTNATKTIQSLGANRIVVPREMNFAKIETIKKNTNIDIEAFIHGALCVCYSGQCYDSTLLDQKSANRGRCSQYCRMPQRVIHKRNNSIISKGNYPLNLKDLNNLENITLYKESGVNSLKIEGRLKGIDYVGLTTKAYHNRLNNINNNIDLTTVYNRTFTSGRINSINGNELVNLNRPNNTGQLIGKVSKVNKNPNRQLSFYKYCIFIDVFEKNKIVKGDNLRFTSSTKESGQIVEQLEKLNNITYLLYSNENITNDYKVYKTKDNELITNYEAHIREIKPLQQNINLDIYLSQQFITYNLTIGDKVVDFTSKITLDVAINKPVSKKDIISNLKKTNKTNFSINIKNIYLEENSFIPIKHIKLLRDEIITNFSKKYSLNTPKSKLNEIYAYLNSINNDSIDISTTKKNMDKNSTKIFYINCKTIQQLEYFSNLLVEKVRINILIDYLLFDELSTNNLDLLKKIKNNYKTFLTLPRIIYDNEEEEVTKAISHFDNLCISEIGSLKYKSLISGEIITNFTFNTTNTLNLNALNNLGIDKHILSIELNKDKINKLGAKDSIVNIYGRIPVMIMDYCPINLKKTNTCGNCNRCRNNDYMIEDNLNRKFPLVYEGNNRIGLYTNEVLSLFNELNKIPNISNYFLNLTFETDNELNILLDSITSKRNYIKNSFDGNFFKETL